jgi:hypothetical protein
MEVKVMDENRTPGRLRLIMLGVIFLGPLLIAYLLYGSGSGWRPAAGTQHGQMLEPPALLPDMPLTSGGSDTASNFRGKWSLIVVDELECGVLCKEVLRETRQIRRALGRDRDRVQRLFYLDGSEPDMKFFTDEHPELIVLQPESPAGQELLAAIGGRESGDIFLADPLGNLIMRFPSGTGMRGIHKDLKLLLKISRIG